MYFDRFGDDSFLRMRRKLEQMQEAEKKTGFFEEQGRVSADFEQRTQELEEKFGEAKQEILNTGKNGDRLRQEFATLKQEFEAFKGHWAQESRQIDEMRASCHLAEEKIKRVVPKIKNSESFLDFVQKFDVNSPLRREFQAFYGRERARDCQEAKEMADGVFERTEQVSQGQATFDTQKCSLEQRLMKLQQRLKKK